MTDSQLATIRKLQELHLALENGLIKKLPEIFVTLADQVIEITNEIPLDAESRADAIRKTVSLKNKIALTVIENKIYQTEVKQVIDGFNSIKSLTDDYFHELIDGFKDQKALYKAVLEVNQKATLESLLGAGIEENFGNAITQVVRANISGTTSRKALNEVVRKAIEGSTDNPAYLNRYIKQVTEDSIQNFNAQYIQTVSSDLNLSYFVYQGTLIADSRPFCQARAGRYYTKSEVQSWANLGKWDGRMPGTTQTSIFVLRGGYSCRHQILPVSKESYQIAKRKGLVGMR